MYLKEHSAWNLRVYLETKPPDFDLCHASNDEETSTQADRVRHLTRKIRIGREDEADPPEAKLYPVIRNITEI